MTQFIPANFAGQRFGAFVVVKQVGYTKKRQSLWLIRADDGSTFVKRVDRIANMTGATRPRHRHGMSRSAEYRIWQGILNRCLNKNVKFYRRYGGRGITVCDAWRHDFQKFYRDMGPRPSPRHSIDRINNDGNYEPANCRWATPAQQAANK